VLNASNRGTEERVSESKPVDVIRASAHTHTEAWMEPVFEGVVASDSPLHQRPTDGPDLSAQEWNGTVTRNNV
jgi:hypothetical protein